jgi:hypothetical protein
MTAPCKRFSNAVEQSAEFLIEQCPVLAAFHEGWSLKSGCQ